MPLISYNTAATGSASGIGGGQSSYSLTWSHAVSGTPRKRVVVVFANVTQSAGNTATISATYGGTAMTSLATVTWYTDFRFGAFVLKDPPTGTQTVSVTWSGLPFTIPTRQFSGVSVVYDDVDTATWVGSVTGTGTTQSAQLTGVGTGNFSVFSHHRRTDPAFSTNSLTSRGTVAAGAFNRMLVQDTTNASGTITSTTTTSASEDSMVAAITLRRAADQEFFNA